MISRRGKFLIALGFAIFPTGAWAQPASSNLSVTATVTANCTVSTSAVAFGNVDPLGGDVDATGGLSVTCSNGTAWAASAGSGGGSGATLAVRRMTFGANTLQYALYTNAGRTTLWGDGSASTATITGTGTGTAQSSTVYGRVPSGQVTAPPGGYADTVAVTVSY